MDDLISRQAAIEAILAIKDYGNSDRANALGLAECAITTLPSAQPEDCDTCRYGHFGDRKCDYCRWAYPSHYERDENEAD